MTMALDGSPRFNGASPTRLTPRKPINTNIKSPRDLERALEALIISDHEHKAIHIQQQKVLAEKAEIKEIAQAKAIEAQQEQTRVHQEEIREQAHAILRKWQEDHDREQALRRETERLQREKEAAEKAERERQIQLEQERLQREAQARADEEAARRRQEQQKAEQAEAQRRQREEEARQKKLEAERQANEQKQQQIAQQKADQESAASSRREAEQRAQAKSAKQAESDSPEAIHAEYLKLYHKIKTWKNDYWKFVREQAKIHKDTAIKETVADARRCITAEVGKLSDDKDLNKKAVTKIRSFIFDNLTIPTKTVGTMVPVNFFLPPQLQLNDNDEAKISDQSAYALVVLAQKVTHIMMKYAFGEPQRAESVGVMTSSIFSAAQIQYNRQNPRTSYEATQNLFPILLAKYHKVCPVLFGISAPTNDQQGRSKLGWALLPSGDDDVPKTILVPENEHFDRMKGLAIGFSSIALRNFASSSARNPFPPTEFWKSLAMIINMPPEKVTATHVCVLRNMFGHRGMTRFMLFFGTVGQAVLREAFVEFPKRLPKEMQGDSFVRELSIFVEKLAKDEHIHLD